MPKLFPSISIIIPTLNSARTLPKCLQSIVMQVYPRDNIEIIIADGGFTDQTLDIISEFSVAPNLEPQTVLFLPLTSILKPQTVPFPPLASILSPPTFKSSPTICRPARLAKPQQ